MTELLALPDWNTPPRTIDDWMAALAALGHPAILARESPGVAWLEVAPLRLRGYAVIESGHVAAINFELNDPDPTPAVKVVEAAAHSIGWEADADEGDDEDDEDGDDD
ncbi:MAG: hypothetical protein ABI353_01690 [Isosphaeraceae bacterium]